MSESAAVAFYRQRGDDLTTGDVEAAGSSARMLSNYIAQKKRRSENR